MLLCLALMLALCGAGTQDKQVVLVVDAQMQTITLYTDGEKQKTWPCAVGKQSTPSPLGVFTINQKGVDWGSGFGTRYLGFYCAYGTFGIHGTNKPGSIGSYASHGCVRLRVEDAQWIYENCDDGTIVVVQ